MFSRSRLLIDLDLIKGSLDKFFLLPKSEFNNYIALLSDGTKILNIMDACKTCLNQMDQISRKNSKLYIFNSTFTNIMALLFCGS